MLPHPARPGGRSRVRRRSRARRAAAATGHAEAVRLLLDARAVHDARDDDGWTPMHFAARFNKAATAPLAPFIRRRSVTTRYDRVTGAPARTDARGGHAHRGGGGP